VSRSLKRAWPVCGECKSVLDAGSAKGIRTHPDGSVTEVFECRCGHARHIKRWPRPGEGRATNGPARTRKEVGRT
jgi:RNase P subunit RPR2